MDPERPPSVMTRFSIRRLLFQRQVSIFSNWMCLMATKSGAIVSLSGSLCPVARVSPAGAFAWWAGECSFTDEIGGAALIPTARLYDLNFEPGVVGSAIQMRNSAWTPLLCRVV